jgi:hypothetical protein
MWSVDSMQQARRTLALLASALLLSCTTPPLALDAIDWSSADEHWSLHIVTTDPEGDERVTRIWLAQVDGAGTLRTGDSRWWHNLQRDPACRIRLDGVDYPVRAESVTDPVGRVRIDDAFLAKYGRWERMVFSQERGETHENYARLLAR